jgi:hypothetical protein
VTLGSNPGIIVSLGGTDLDITLGDPPFDSHSMSGSCSISELRRALDYLDGGVTQAVSE